VFEGYLFKEETFCIPQESHGKLLVKEIHKGGIMVHFRVDTTLSMLDKFFWPFIGRDVQGLYHRCISCL